MSFEAFYPFSAGSLIFEMAIVIDMLYYALLTSICLVTRFDGRALLDFIRDADSRRFRQQEKSLEEEEVEEFVNFERYRDLIKHRRRGCRYFLIYSISIIYFIISFDIFASFSVLAIES